MPYTGPSIVDYLKSAGKPSSFSERAKLATQQGITNYTGTAAQNTQLLNTLRGGAEPPTPTPTPAPTPAPIPTPTRSTLGRDLPFPTTQVEMAEYRARHTFTGGKWYESKRVTPTPIPTPTPMPTPTSTPTPTPTPTPKPFSLADLGIDIGEEVGVTSAAARKKEREEAGEALEAIEAPEAPGFATTFSTLMSETGISGIQTDINAKKALKRDLEASLREGLYDEEGKLKPMELIGAAQQELQKQGQRKIDAINRDITTLLDEYNVKVGMIDTQMQLLGMDYDASVDTYNREFNKQLKMIGLMEADWSQEDKQANMQTDLAKANWGVMTKAIEGALSDGSLDSYDTLSDEIKTQIRNFEVKMGLPEGFTQTVLANVNPAKGVLQKVVSKDKSQVSIIYDDGSTDVFSTGLAPEGVPGVGEPKIELSETQLNNAIENAGISEADFMRLDEESQRIFAFGDVPGMKKDITDELEDKTSEGDLEKSISEMDIPDPIKDTLTRHLKEEVKRLGTITKEEPERILDEKIIKKLAISFVKSMGKESAIKHINEVGTIEDAEGKEVELTDSQKKQIVDKINEEYPQGRTFLQKITPGGK